MRSRGSNEMAKRSEQLTRFRRGKRFQPRFRLRTFPICSTLWAESACKCGRSAERSEIFAPNFCQSFRCTRSHRHLQQFLHLQALCNQSVQFNSMNLRIVGVPVVFRRRLLLLRLRRLFWAVRRSGAASGAVRNGGSIERELVPS